MTTRTTTDPSPTRSQGQGCSMSATSSSGSTSEASGPDVLLHRRPERPGRGLDLPARRARRPLPPHRLRQPGRRPFADAAGRLHRRRHGRRRRRRCCGRSASSGAHVAGLLRRQRHRPGAGAAPPRSRPQPRARQHLGPARRVPAHDGHGRVDVAARGGTERAGDARGVLPLDLHAPRPRERHGRRRSSRTPCRSRTRSRRRRFLRQLDAWMAARHARPPARDHRADAGGRRRDRHRHPAPLRAGRRRRGSRAPSSSCCPARPTSRSRSAPRRSTRMVDAFWSSLD